MSSKRRASCWRTRSARCRWLKAGKVVGIVTETDVLRQICKIDAECAKDIAEIVVSYP